MSPPSLPHAAAWITALVVLAFAPAARAQCPIAGAFVTLPRVTVQPPGVAPFDLSVRGQPVRARYVAGRADVPIEVAGALTFRATTASTPLALARRVVVADGVVTLAASVPVTSGRALSSGHVAVTAALQAGEVTLHDLAVPCDALMLDVARREPPGLRAGHSRGRASWLARGRRLTLRAAPAGGVVARAVGRSTTSIVVREVERQGIWLKVEQRFGDGSLLRGWVTQAELAPMPSGYGNSYSTCGGIGYATRTITVRGGYGVYEGPAEIVPGTTVFARLGGQAPWAEVSTRAPLRVRHVVGDAWVQVMEVPGIAALGHGVELAHAWVPRAAVRFPTAAGARDY